jgi:hypothetical protein
MMTPITLIGEYVLDGDDRRIQVTENNETTTYIYTGWSVPSLSWRDTLFNGLLLSLSEQRLE